MDLFCALKVVIAEQRHRTCPWSCSRWEVCSDRAWGFVSLYSCRGASKWDSFPKERHAFPTDVSRWQAGASMSEAMSLPPAASSAFQHTQGYSKGFVWVD